MKNPNLLLLVILWIEAPPTASFLHAQNGCGSKKSAISFNRNRLQMGVEHLINCNPGDLVKFTDMCLDTNKDHITQSLFVDLFEKIVNIGLLVASYFYFKRLANISDSSRSDSEMERDRGNEFSNYEEYEPRECPKCNGSGRSLTNRGQVCGLCGGVGILEFPPVIQSLKLPRSREDQS